MSDRRRGFDFEEALPSMEELHANGGRLLVTLCLRELANDSYPAYLQTNHWQDVRRRRLKIDGYRCQVCLGKGRLNVHHITYEHLGDEPMEDVATLCREHHEIQHATLAIRARAELEARLSE